MLGMVRARPISCFVVVLHFFCPISIVSPNKTQGTKGLCMHAPEALLFIGGAPGGYI